MALNDVVYNKTVDVAQSMPVPVVFAKQNENGKRKVIVTLLKDGQPFVIGTGISGYIQGATAQNPVTKQPIRFKRELTSLDTTANTATFVIAESMTAEIGVTQCEIALYDSTKPNEILCTANINIEVQGTGMSPQDEMASDDYQAIVSIKAEVTAMRDEVRDKTNQAIAAKSAAETAAQNAYNSALGVQKIVAGNEAYTKQEADLKYSVAPRKVQSTTTGEMQLTDTDDGLAYLSLEGNSEQYTNMGNKNLIDLEYQKLHGINENRYLNVNGVLTTPASDKDWKVSYYIKVKPSTVYAFTDLPTSSVTAIAFYTQDKTFISAVTNMAVLQNGGIITIPSNCEYIRVSFRAGTENTLQLEEGNVATAYIKGAVDTPSPEYPSEVKSVGDIPKDSNEVEIRNLLDEEWIKNQPESAWDKYIDTENNYVMYRYALPDEFKKRLTTMGRITGIIDNLNNYRIILLNKQGIKPSYFLNLNGLESTGSVDYTGDEIVYFAVFIHKTQVATFDQVKEILYNMNLMITEAAEIDEYRPYIGENNGLVKLESMGKNLFDINIFNGVNNTVQINGNEVTWTSWSGIPSFNMIKKGFKENTQYCVSFDKKADGITLTRIVITYTDGTADGKGTETNTEYKHYTGVSRAGKTIKSITATYAACEDSYKMFFRNIQIEEGTKETPYQPYHQQITWIPLREPLRAIKTDYNIFGDTVDKNGNVTEKIMKMKMSEVLNLNNGWGADPKGINTTSSDIKFAYYTMDDTYKLANADTNIPCLCEKLKYSRNGISPTVESIWHSSVIVFQIKNIRTGLSDTETDTIVIAKAISDYIKANDYVVYYLLADTNFSNYQIPAVYIETYQQGTNIRCLNEVKPSSMNMDYKIAINSLIKRLEALETTAVTEVNKNV